MKPAESQARRQTSQSARAPNTKHSGFFARMPRTFNIVRAGIYLSVLLWSIVCLAVAAHFEGLLVSDDLTKFVPFTLFVCSVSLLLMLALLGFTLRRSLNPISTRVELTCLAFGGTLWLALGAFLASSDSQEADVECFTSGNEQDLISVPGFSTETYHAQYHVLEAFSLFNMIILWGFLCFLLLLAIREHRKDHTSVWYTPTPMYPWFRSSSGKLPHPATSRTRGRPKTSRNASMSEKPLFGAKDKAKRVAPDPKFTPRPPRRVHTMGGRDRVDKYHRDASPRR